MYGLVLEGGGAKGAYHIGAYKAILEEGMDIGAVAGTSVGALNGGLIAQRDMDKAWELWENMTYSRVINADEDKIYRFKDGKFSLEDIRGLKDQVKSVFQGRGVDISPLKELIGQLVDEDRMRSSGIDFGMVTVSLTDLKPIEIFIEDIDYGKIKDYLLASAYFPLFKSEKLDGKTYIDGGIYNNLPTNLLTDRGYKKIIQVRTHEKKLLEKDREIEGVELINIQPQESLGTAMDFANERARYNLKLGYYDGLKALRNYKGRSYYIDSNISSDSIFYYMAELKEEKIDLLTKLLKIDPKMEPKRAVFEGIIPRIASFLDLDKEASYEDILCSFLEAMATIYGLERFRVYELDELLYLIKDKLMASFSKDLNIDDRLEGRFDFMRFLDRESSLKEIGYILLKA